MFIVYDSCFMFDAIIEVNILVLNKYAEYMDYMMKNIDWNW